VIYYHASRIKGLKSLKPSISNHGKSLVYFSSKKENTLVYLSNAIEVVCRQKGLILDKYQKWASYGFKDGLLKLDEYYLDATKETYQNVSGYIYTVEAELERLEEISDCYISDKEVEVKECEFIPDAYEALLKAEKENKIILQTYDQMSDRQKQWLKETIKKEYLEAKEDYRLFLETKFSEYLKS